MPTSKYPAPQDKKSGPTSSNKGHDKTSANIDRGDRSSTPKPGGTREVQQTQGGRGNVQSPTQSGAKITKDLNPDPSKKSSGSTSSSSRPSA